MCPGGINKNRVWLHILIKIHVVSSLKATEYISFFSCIIFSFLGSDSYTTPNLILPGKVALHNAYHGDSICIHHLIFIIYAQGCV